MISHIVRENLTLIGERRIRFHRELIKNYDMRVHWFYNRVSGYWNGLSEYVVNSSTVNEFMYRLDKLGSLLSFNLRRLAR